MTDLLTPVARHLARVIPGSIIETTLIILIVVPSITCSTSASIAFDRRTTASRTCVCHCVLANDVPYAM